LNTLLFFWFYFDQC